MRRKPVIAVAGILRAACVVFLAAVPFTAIPSAAFAEELQKEEFYRRSAELRVFSDDLYARVTVKSRDAATAEYALFRRDRTSSALLLQRLPSYASGIAWLDVANSLVVYNPDCACFDSVDASALGAELIFLQELSPAIRGNAGRVIAETRSVGKNGPVRVLEISRTNGTIDRITMDEKTFLPLEAEYAAAAFQDKAVVTYLSYGDYNGKYLPVKMSVRVAGREYEVTLSDISFNPITDAVFTRAFCEEISK